MSAVNLYEMKNLEKQVVAFEGCETGKCKGRRYMVQHPDHGAVLVIAPDQYAAMATAAKHWGVRWQALEFHQDVKVEVAG